MNKYTIEYSLGGTKGCIEAEDHLNAIIKDAKRSMPKGRFRFFETYPKLDPAHFVVTNENDKTVKYYKMVAQ